jgi:hypothetical protein
MNDQLDFHDPLDRAVRSVLADIVAATPPSDAEPAPGTTLATGDGRSRPYPVLMAAAVVAIAGVVGALVVMNGRGELSPASSPSNIPAAPVAAVGPTGPLLSTALPGDAVPYIVAGDGWQLTDVYANVGPLLVGGFEGATVFVGEGPTFDAPIFAATVVDQPQDGSSIDTLMSEGDPVAVAGVTGSVYLDRTGSSDPFVTMFWRLDDTRYARISAKGLTVDEAVAFADRLTLDGARLVMDTPDGYRALVTPPVTGSRRSINYRFSDGTREIDLNGDNRGVADLLSQGVIADDTTTRTVNGVELAFRVENDGTTVNRIFWLSGDWSFYVIAEGFTDEAELLDVVASLTLTDPATFAAAGPGLDIVMPGDHTELATAVLGGLGLTDTTLTDAATTEMPTSAYHYGFELVQGASCILADRWTALSPDNTAENTAFSALVEATATAAAQAGHRRAADIMLTPLLDMSNGRLPQTELSDEADCPTWSTPA